MKQPPSLHGENFSLIVFAPKNLMDEPLEILFILKLNLDLVFPFSRLYANIGLECFSERSRHRFVHRRKRGAGS